MTLVGYRIAEKLFWRVDVRIRCLGLTDYYTYIYTAVGNKVGIRVWDTFAPEGRAAEAVNAALGG